MENTRLLISKLTIATVLLASFVVFVGGFMYLWQHSHDIASYQLFQGEPKPFTSFLGIWRDALTLSARGVMQLGLLLLVLGQSVRVLFTMILFVKEKDCFFSIASLIILLILLISLL